MRDSRKSTDYFIEELDANEYSIDLIRTDLISNTLGKDAVSRSKTALYIDHHRKIFSQYALGNSKTELEVSLHRLLDDFNAKFLDLDFSYTESLDILSIAYCLEMNPTPFVPFVAELMSLGQYDHLMGLIVNGMGIEVDVPDNTLWEEPYGHLLKVYDADQSNQLAGIKDYLQHKWYKGHSDTAWYDSHKGDTYFGYWSFESAAIVKLLGLDDSELQGLDYYPYDLVHFNDPV